MANKTILALMASAIAAGGFSAAAQNNDVVLTSETILQKPRQNYLDPISKEMLHVHK